MILGHSISYLLRVDYRIIHSVAAAMCTLKVARRVLLSPILSSRLGKQCYHYGSG